MILSGKEKNLGDGFTVRRVLPNARRRMVGPFIFFDHMGPATFAPGKRFDVRPHPHINLATVTYLFDGEIMHRDSLGSAQPIRPGAVNWMSAGRGITHSERTSAERQESGQHMEGIQAWVALPRAHEDGEPSFRHHPEDSLPVAEWDGANARLIAGSAYGMKSPVEYPGGIFYVHVEAEAGAAVSFPEGHEEMALYVVDGEARFRGETLTGGQMMMADGAGPDEPIECSVKSRLMLLGGAGMDGPRHIWWNFVSSSPQRIREAADDWREGRFPLVPGDSEDRIPLPEEGPPPPVQAGS